MMLLKWLLPSLFVGRVMSNDASDGGAGDRMVPGDMASNATHCCALQAAFGFCPSTQDTQRHEKGDGQKFRIHVNPLIQGGRWENIIAKNF